MKENNPKKQNKRLNIKQNLQQNKIQNIPKNHINNMRKNHINKEKSIMMERKIKKKNKHT